MPAPESHRESVNDGHEFVLDSISPSDQSDVPYVFSRADAILNEASPDDRSDPQSSIFADPTIECNKYITVSIDAHGQLKPKATTVSDYIYWPNTM